MCVRERESNCEWMSDKEREEVCVRVLVRERERLCVWMSKIVVMIVTKKNANYFDRHVTPFFDALNCLWIGETVNTISMFAFLFIKADLTFTHVFRTVMQIHLTM